MADMAQIVIDEKKHAVKEKEDVAVEETKNPVEENKQAHIKKEDAKPMASQPKKCPLWTSTEFELLARSLIVNGSSTTYDTMSEHVLTQTKSAITAYYNNNKKIITVPHFICKAGYWERSAYGKWG